MILSPSLATTEDLRPLWKLIQKCSDWLLSQGYDHWANFYTEDKVKAKLEHGRVYILREEGKIIASIAINTDKIDYWTEKDIENFQEPKEKGLNISMMGVDPEFQGNGIASKLLDFADKTAKNKNIKYVRFDCRALYPKLVRFYLKRGYKIVGVTLDQEANDEPYFLLEKKVI